MTIVVVTTTACTDETILTPVRFSAPEVRHHPRRRAVHKCRRLDHPQLPGGRDADARDRVVQGRHGRATDHHGGHIQRRHRAAHLQHPDGGHRRLHVHRAQRRGPDQPHGARADRGRRGDHVAAHQPDEAGGREGGVHVRRQGDAGQRDGPVVARRRVRQVHLVAGDPGDHQEGRVHDHKPRERRRLGPVPVRGQQRHRRPAVRVRVPKRRM